jgi:hypothetical protein
LYSCVKELKASVDNGRFNEDVVKETPVYSFNSYLSYKNTMIKMPCFVDGIQYDEQKLSLIPVLGALDGSARVENKNYYYILIAISDSTHCFHNCITSVGDRVECVFKGADSCLEVFDVAISLLGKQRDIHNVVGGDGEDGK